MLQMGNGEHQDFSTFLAPCISVSKCLCQRQLKYLLQSSYSEDRHLCPVIFLVAN